MSNESLLASLKEKMLTDVSELVGRKIVAAHRDWSCNLYLRLEDDRFCIISAEPDYGNCASLDIKSEVCPFDDFGCLVEIGVMTKMAHDVYTANRKRERDLQDLKQKKREYAQLKKLFEKEDLTSA